MSWEATAYVNSIRSGISRSEKLLLLVLANYHNKDKRAAWPSLKSLSEDGLISVRQASRLVNRLQAKGVLTITPEGARGLNIYRFVGFDVEPTIDKVSIVPPVPTIDISRTTIDISDPTIDIAVSTNPTREPTTEPSVKRAASRAPADERLQHPAIQALRGLARTYPDKTSWDQLIRLLGDTPDLERLSACFSEWTGRGFKKTNWLGIVEWYIDGIPKATAKSNGHSKSSANVGVSTPEAEGCGKPARFSYNWPGRDSGVCCEDCLARLKLASAALNEAVTIRELTGKPQICP